MTSPTKSRLYQEERILRLAESTGKLIGLDDASDITESDIHLDDNFVGEAYGILDIDTAETMDMTIRTDSLLLDPVYTGKVMRGMLHRAQSGQIFPMSRSQDGTQAPVNVLFIHTGGQNVLDAYADVWPGKVSP